MSQDLNSSSASEHSRDSEGSSDSSNDDIQWKRSKIHKKHRAVTQSECPAFTSEALQFSQQRKLSTTTVTGRRKPNCIWNSVLAEQDLVEDLTTVGVHTERYNKNRGCESYDYSMKDCYDTDNPVRQQHSSNMNYYKEFGRKRNLNRRVQQRKEERCYGCTENDSDEKVTGIIAQVLKEPKLDLIEKSVKSLGKKKALELLNRTEDIEECGGMMTADGSRRRTPGGVYLLLIRQDDDISKEHKSCIFGEDKKLQVMAKRAIIRAKRRKAVRDAEDASGSLTPLPTLEEILLKESESAEAMS